MGGTADLVSMYAKRDGSLACLGKSQCRKLFQPTAWCGPCSRPRVDCERKETWNSVFDWLENTQAVSSTAVCFDSERGVTVWWRLSCSTTPTPQSELKPNGSRGGWVVSITGRAGYAHRSATGCRLLPTSHDSRRDRSVRSQRDEVSPWHSLPADSKILRIIQISLPLYYGDEADTPKTTDGVVGVLAFSSETTASKVWAGEMGR